MLVLPRPLLMGGNPCDLLSIRGGRCRTVRSLNYQGKLSRARAGAQLSSGIGEASIVNAVGAPITAVIMSTLSRRSRWRHHGH
jgi:hypothetical protein